jgi:CMP-N,N'-diacetyllegionaminic acid synthase
LVDKCWAIIPARGGSSGVKGKNIKVLGDKPLIGHAITALQEANVFEKVLVTSDSKEILNVAEDFGAEVYLRSSRDESNSVVMTDVPVMSYLQSVPEILRPKFCLMVQCTAPFITSASYRKAYNELLKKEHATIFAAHEAHSFLWQREREDNLDSKWLPINHPFSERVGRQFKKVQQIHETGAFYGFPVNAFLASGYRFFSEAFPVLIEGDELIDIDDVYDWEFAQFTILNKKL